MVLMEPLLFQFLLVFKKMVFLRIILANSCQKKLLANDELQEYCSLYTIGRH